MVYEVNLQQGFSGAQLEPSSQLQMNPYAISIAEMPSFCSHTKVTGEKSICEYVYRYLFQIRSLFLAVTLRFTTISHVDHQTTALWEP